MKSMTQTELEDTCNTGMKKNGEVESFKDFCLKVITARTGVSSKRVCGVIGWIICLGVLIYGTIANAEVPDMIDTVLLCCMGLLGIDSITGIWKKFN